MEKICKFANFAKLAYEDFDDIGNLVFINDEKLEFYIYKRENVLWIIFRGTDSVTDFKTDMFFVKKSIHQKNIRLHSGFLNSYLLYREFILKHINEEIDEINITGHSYGGAVAVICSIDIVNENPQKMVETIVFGCPKVGNRAFSKIYNEMHRKTICVANGNDPIASLPPSIFGFRKVGKQFFIGKMRIPFYYSFKNHAMNSYLSELDCVNYSTKHNLVAFLNKLKSTYKTKN